MFAQVCSTITHSPGSPLSLRLWLQVEQELGMEKFCCFVDISCNYNLATSTYWHLQFTRPLGLLMGWVLLNSISNTTDFQEASCKVKYSLHSLRKKKERKGRRVRCSASLIITGGTLIKNKKSGSIRQNWNPNCLQTGNGGREPDDDGIPIQVPWEWT